MLIPLFAIVLTTVFAAFSTVVMSYISMATPIGPWIGPTLVLIGSLLFRLFGLQREQVGLSLVVVGASVGGILATAFGFSFPTLYFADPAGFNELIAHPWRFSLFVSVCALVSGWFGLWIASLEQKTLLEQKALPFPIGQLIYKMIYVQNQAHKGFELLAGFCVTMLYGMAQVGIVGFRGLFPASVTLTSSCRYGVFSVPSLSLSLDILPMLLAIGFITGHLIAIPLLVGALGKIILVDPVNRIFFSTVSSQDFMLAFCSGLVFSGTLSSFIKLPSMIAKGFKKLRMATGSGTFSPGSLSMSLVLEGVLCVGALSAFLFYCGIPIIAQLFVVGVTVICIYQISIIAGEVGLAPLGRFATFVMVPAMLLFKLDYRAIVVIATFVEASSGVAADALFGRKIGMLANVSPNRVKFFQYLGLVVSSALIGIVFLLLIQALGLGTPALCAYKAQSRQLLIQVNSFDYSVLCVGLLTGYLLSYTKINPVLVLGGLLMQLPTSLGLIAGGFLAKAFSDPEQWHPLWSGVFAANSIWMLIAALIRR